MDETPTTWNSLEVAKLAVGLLVPIVLVIAGFWLNANLQAAANRSQVQIANLEMKNADDIAAATCAEWLLT